MPKQYCNLLYKHPYTGGGDLKSTETPEFIIRISPEDFEQWKKSKSFHIILSLLGKLISLSHLEPNETPIVEVVDCYEVFVSRARGHTGTLERPSNKELMDAFGSVKFEDIFNFMAEHGTLQHAESNVSKRDLWYYLFLFALFWLK